MRVAGDAPERTVGLQGVGELGGRRLADDDRPGATQGGDDVGVPVGHPVLEGVRTERRAVTGDRRGVLDRDGYAVEHAEEVVAAGDRVGGPLGSRRASSSHTSVKQFRCGCTRPPARSPPPPPRPAKLAGGDQPRRLAGRSASMSGPRGLAWTDGTIARSAGAHSSAGQSAALTRQMPGVRVPLRPPGIVERSGTRGAVSRPVVSRHHRRDQRDALTVTHRLRLLQHLRQIVEGPPGTAPRRPQLAAESVRFALAPAGAGRTCRSAPGCSSRATTTTSPATDADPRPRGASAHRHHTERVFAHQVPR